MEDNILKTIEEANKECQDNFRELFDLMEEDLKFYVGGDGQWTVDDINAIKSSHNVQITINIIKKQIDTLLGRREQTLTDLKAYPVEIQDDEISDIMSKALKWSMDVGNAQNVISQAYKNQLISGLGWIFIDTDTKGNVRFCSESPLNVYFDPYCKDLMGLSDCDYIIRFKQTTKKELIRVFPDKEDEIQQLKDIQDDLYRSQSNASKRKEKVVVKEYWYRDEEDETWIVNVEDPNDAEVWEGTEEDLNYFLAANPHLTSEKRKTPVIKVATVSGNVILQENITFSKGNIYPFIPFVGFYIDALEEWKYKLHGHVRNLKDIQRELNARHCALMAITQKTPLGMWIAEESAIKDVEDLKKTGGKVGFLPYRRGSNPPQFIPQPTLPSGEVQLLQLFVNDMNQVGLPPEVTGTPTNLESGKAISLVQAVGLTSVAELNSHLNFALKKLGAYVIRLILNTFPKIKFEKIVGYEIPDEIYSMLRKDIDYNIAVDETSRSVTSQLAAYESLFGQAQHGIPVPPQTLIEKNPYLSPEDKKVILQQQEQMQQQQLLQQQGVQQQ